ncbi:MAG: hypothetical protein QN131_10515 [Armatimonadota bacterium]|nr:hypothetical protein [Armatimonadota bacterium]MDR7550355.1 hypothetical protein [Armatimonadota bacterium]
MPRVVGAGLLVLAVAGVPTSPSWAAALPWTMMQTRVILREGFAAGSTQVAWQTFPGFSPDPLQPVPRPDAPDGDGWAGLVSNRTLGGFASLSYAGPADLDDYSVEAWVYVDVVEAPQGPLQGIAIRVDPVQRRYYRFSARFNAEPSLSLAYVGRDVNNFPDFLREWQPAEIPGGLPSTGGWHRMKLRAVGDRLWAYWNGVLLPGMPVRDGRIRRGHVGVYATFVGGQQLAQTVVDDLVVVHEGPGE